ncbi:MAG: ABC transporter substrate-binding protein [Propionibacteriaceae bacterium]
MVDPAGTTIEHHPRRWRRTLLAVAAAALALPLALSAPAATPASAAEGANLKVALTSDIDTLNPFLAILASSTGILRFQYESLVQYGTKNEVVPGLAEKWESSPDAKTWTFTLPADRKWSDGEPLTAEDAAWTFNAVKTTEALQQANGGLVSNVNTVTAKDPQTLVMVLNSPQASNPGSELPIVPQHVWEKVDAATYANDTDTVGSGPFTIKSYAKSQSVDLVANPNFWRGAPKIAGLTYVSYKSTDAAVQALRTGEVDVVSGLTPAQFGSLKGQQGIETNSGAGRRYQALSINSGAIDADGKPLGNGNPALKDIALRQAIFTAIDNKTLLEKVLQGLGKPGQTEIPSVYPDYFGFAPGYTPRTFDPAAANKILDDAGYTKGADGIRVDKTGKPLKLRLMGRNTDPTHQQLADFVKPWLKDVGIDVTVSMVTPNQVNDDSTLGKYDLYFTGWGIGPDPDFQLSINRCDSRPNADGSGSTSESNWCSPEFDKLYDAQHAELDQAKRSALVKEAFTTIDKAAVNDVLYYADSLEAYRSDKFTGFTKQPEEGGVITGQNGYWGFYSATEVSTATEEGSGTGGGLSGGTIAIVIAAVIVAAGAVVLVLRRRRSTAADRE